MKDYTVDEWMEEAEKRFGADMEEWKFICPNCGRVNAGKEFKGLSKPRSWHNAMYQECIGNYVKGEGCNWKAYGFLKGNVDTVVDKNGKQWSVFRFAD